MTLAFTAGIFAGIVEFASFFPYISSILKRKTKPNRASFLIWAAIDTVALVSYVSAGAHDSAYYILSFTVMGYVVLGLALKYGVGGAGKLDIACLAVSLAGIIGWLVTKNPLIALYINVALDAIGYLPTIKKTYFEPHTESALSWSMATIGAFINLFALTTFQPSQALYPVVLLICDATLAAVILLRRRGVQAQ